MEGCCQQPPKTQPPGFFLVKTDFPNIMNSQEDSEKPANTFF
jgi:hypothetical protein